MNAPPRPPLTCALAGTRFASDAALSCAHLHLLLLRYALVNVLRGVPPVKTDQCYASAPSLVTFDRPTTHTLTYFYFVVLCQGIAFFVFCDFHQRQKQPDNLSSRKLHLSCRATSVVSQTLFSSQPPICCQQKFRSLRSSGLSI